MLPAKQTPPAPQIGQVLWHNGVLLFTLRKTPETATVVSTGDLEQFLKFASYIGEIQLPTDTPLEFVKELYHFFTLFGILKENGIDMCPVVDLAQSKNNFKALTSLKLVISSVLLLPARKLFKRISGGFLFLKTHRGRE